MTIELPPTRSARPSDAPLDDAAAGDERLWAAVADEHERDLAAASDAALVAYQHKWERKIARLQRAHRARWHVPGLSDDEVRDALTLRLIEAIRAPEGATDAARASSTGAPAPPAGKEWGLCVVEAELAALRRRFRLGATPMDFEGAALREREPSQEERWLELEAERCRALAEEQAERRLSRSLARWLDALKSAARDGAFFQTSDRLNSSAASRRLDRNRSSAARAYNALRVLFTSELERVESPARCATAPDALNRCGRRRTLRWP
jgi:hypothetical protein